MIVKNFLPGIDRREDAEKRDRTSCFGLFGRGEEYRIPWECIKQIGDDIVLIDKPFPRQEIPRRERRTRRRF